MEMHYTVWLNMVWVQGNMQVLIAVDRYVEFVITPPRHSTREDQ